MVLANKVAIVTGSSRGIGKAIALELASLGADVVVCARTDREGGELPGTIAETAEKVRALGRRALAVKMDVTQEADVQAMVDQAQAEFGIYKFWAELMDAESRDDLFERRARRDRKLR